MACGYGLLVYSRTSWKSQTISVCMAFPGRSVWLFKEFLLVSCQTTHMPSQLRPNLRLQGRQRSILKIFFLLNILRCGQTILDHAHTCQARDQNLPLLIGHVAGSHLAAQLKIINFFDAVAKEKCPPETCLYKRNRKDAQWISCSSCKQWFHARCVGISKAKLQTIIQWSCVNCQQS